MQLPFIAEWSTFLAVEAGAAATLTGLVFVAVSLNLQKIMSFPGLPGRAGESILQLLQIFFIATILLVPGQPLRLLALEILLIAAVSWAAQVAGQIHYRRSAKDHPLSWVLFRAIFTQAATLPFCIAGLGLLFGYGHLHALYWIVPGVIFSFVGAVFSAWVLLIEILR